MAKMAKINSRHDRRFISGFGKFLTYDALFLGEDLIAVLDPFGADQKSKKKRSRLWPIQGRRFPSPNC